ncbi:MAG TPA: tetratricopeptide repeat protein [Burkholderiaceae bacterium]|nr:tetratricopeptide repeat protein [Burkholderiaceae bacterium]
MDLSLDADPLSGAPANLILFGPPQVEFAGTTAALAFERRSQLLVFLALKGSWVGRAELAALFWPELETRLAYTNLRKVLFRFQSFPWSGGLQRQGGAARFDASTDVQAFELALGAGRVEHALRLQRGELLAGFDDGQSDAWSSWLSFERERIATAARNAILLRLGAPDLAAAAGIALATQLLALDPLDEAALLAQMRLLARDGQGARARHAYQAFEARLADELGLVPGAELKQLADALGASAVPAQRPPPPAAASDDGFVGRSLELREIARLLAQEGCRLLTLIGPGGVGKSRLARRALETSGRDYPDGAIFVALEDIGSAREIGALLARELGIEPVARANPLDRVIELLQGRRLLVVLDNFEHLTGDASILETLLQASPGLKLVVTSRMRLATASEWLLPLEGMPWPDPEDEEHAEGFDAVRLFVRSARRVQPALVVANEIASIIDICRRVEGLPLALELTAGWTRVLSCRDIAAELGRGAELLRAADASHAVRHASIEAVFDRSWRLLSARERSVLTRLAVFRGGFTAGAARDIAAASLPVLGALVDKSLLRKSGERLLLHPLVHQLAGLRLSDDPEARSATERAHALYFHRLLAQLRRPVGSGDREALERIGSEFDNCRRAWRWAVRNEAVDELSRSTQTLFDFVDHQGGLEDALELLREAAVLPPTQASAALQATFGSVIAHIEYRLDRHATAGATALQALGAARAARDYGAQALSLNVLGSCALRLGRPADARRLFARALRRAVAAGNPHQVAALLDNLALAEKALGRYDESLRLSLQSLQRHRDLDDAAGLALCLNNLGVLYGVKRDFESSRVKHHEGLAICERHGIVGTRALILANLIDVAIETGDLPAADALAARALEAARSAGNRGLLAYLQLYFVRLDLLRDDLAQARAHLAAALDIGLATRRAPLHLNAVSFFGDLLAAQGESLCARAVWKFAAAHPAASAPEREALHTRLADTPAGDAGPAWPGLELEELLHRVVAESGVAYAPLIALLRGAERARNAVPDTVHAAT